VLAISLFRFVYSLAVGCVFFVVDCLQLLQRLLVSMKLIHPLKKIKKKNKKRNRRVGDLANEI
jgi:hypothetical protein